ncbi:Transcriptional regulator protein (plasmid) [Agrobacterium pusense]|uniref:Transcriptional regulator protein n=2 Tax=Agrobacterium pusense TaxID=648995 RepID=U4Q517_9HYPH|nr:Transcriptional regulator protein [Agrobacterium pusense]
MLGGQYASSLHELKVCIRVKIDQQTTRAMNRRLILNLIRREEQLSRADVAAATGLSPAAVTFVVSDLISEGYLIEGKTIPGGGGRRPIPLEINYAGHLAIGIKMNVGSLECVLTDLSTATLSSLTIEFKDPSPQSVLDVAQKAVTRLQRLAPEGAGLLTGVGFSMPGTIDAERGICIKSHRFFWENVPFASMLQERVNVPVWMEDDTLAFALAQHLFGLGRQHKVFTAVAIGVGIGCATVVDGKVQRGAHGHAGKIGHSMHHPDGPLCECGRHGCLQAYYSEPAILERWRQARGKDGNVDRYAMKEAALQGDPAALDILQEAGAAIGLHLARMVDIVDPEIIIVGGEAVSFGDLLFNPMRKALELNCFTPPPALVPDERDNFWSSGAAALATQGLFNFEMTTPAFST